MKRFLLLALTAGLLSPIAAKAETYWLILVAGQNLQLPERLVGWRRTGTHRCSVALDYQ